MDYQTLLTKIETYKSKYNVKVIGKTIFNRSIFAVEKNVKADFYTAIFIASVHARENVTTDLLCKMLDEGLFDRVNHFNLAFILMVNPDGVELCYKGVDSAFLNARKTLLEMNGNSVDFSMWKANGRGVDLNNNFDANFGTNVHSKKPSPSGFIGEFAESENETKAIVCYTKSKKVFLTLSYHSKGEEIYFNFFQTGTQLLRDRFIAKRFASSTGYMVRNVEKVSSGGYKDFCVQRLGVPALTIEVGSDELNHPISVDFLDDIYQKHERVAKDVEFAYNVFIEYKR